MSLSRADVLVLCHGDRNTGLGHVYRMSTFARALRERGLDCLVATEERTPGQEVLQRNGLPVLLMRGRTVEHDAEVLDRTRPKLCISDRLATDEAQIAVMRCFAERTLSFDDTGAALASADAVVNAIVFHWGLYKPELAATALFEGPDYTILHPDVVRAAADRRRQIRMPGRRITVAMGGADSRDLTGPIVRALLSGDELLEIEVNFGDAAMTETLADVDSGAHRLTIRHRTPDLAAVIAQSDLIICGGGMLLSEAIAVGVPAIAVAAESHEELNIRFWAERGAAVDGGSYNRFRPENVAAAARDVLVSPFRATEHIAAWSGRLCSGLRRCIEIAEATLRGDLTGVGGERETTAPRR